MDSSDELTEVLLEWCALRRQVKRGDYGGGPRFDRAIARIAELERRAAELEQEENR